MDKKALIACAMSAVSLATNAHGADGDTPVSQEVEKCFGIQKCKGMNVCGVDASDIKAVNETFKNKFAKNSPYECAGNVPASAQNGGLGWLYVAKESCVKVAGGFLIETKNGKKVVVKG